jgi:response regulator of citrate/malate metabolism
MIVTRYKYNRDMRAKQETIDELNLLIDNVSAKELERARKRVQKIKDNRINLSNHQLEYEEGPNPMFAPKKPLPPRSEYDARVNEAIELFRQRKNRTQVEKALDVSRKTARKYLQIAIAKRKVKKSDYDTLNQ